MPLNYVELVPTGKHLLVPKKSSKVRKTRKRGGEAEEEKEGEERGGEERGKEGNGRGPRDVAVRRLDEVKQGRLL